MSDGTTAHEDSLTPFIEQLGAVATAHFATGDVTTPVLHFRTDTAMGVLPLFPLPGLDAAPMARLVVGLYDPPVAAVLAEGWATNLTLPQDINEALAGQRPWSAVRERIDTRVAPALRRYPALAEALRRGDVAALNTTHRQALAYAWHDATMGPVLRGEKSLRDLPASMRRKIMILFGEDRRGHSQTRLWRIEQRAGRRHFVPEPLEGANEFASRWRPLYIAWTMAAQAGVPMTLMRRASETSAASNCSRTSWSTVSPSRMWRPSSTRPDHLIDSKCMGLHGLQHPRPGQIGGTCRRCAGWRG